MNNFFAPEPKELVSDSLKESLPTEQDYQQIYQESFISILLHFGDGPHGLFGTLIGIELSESIKLDARIATDEAFDFIQRLIDKNQREISNVILSYDDKVIKLKGPYNLLGAKIIEFDANNKICVLAIDLIKVNLEKK